MPYTLDDFETIYHATYPRLSRYAFSKTRVYSDAEDLLQDVYYAFYQHLQKTDETLKNPQAYLFTMMDHALAHYYEKLDHSASTLKEDSPIFETIPDELDMELSVLQKLSLDEIWTLIESLKEPDRSLLIGRFRFDYRYTELSELFNLPETTVKSKVYAAIEWIKQHIK